MALACVAWGQEPSSTNRFIAPDDTPPAPRTPSKVAPDLRDIDFSSFARIVGQVSGRTLVVGAGVCALINATWDHELTGEQFYQEFVSIAHALGFIVVEQDSVTTISLGKDRKGASACGSYSNRASASESVSARPR
ncbi:hypothetical protein [Steroidobacter agaridevorans]|uniref:hypothetical protein n=1 Tax=Steroidobacter agaridevorans TaxID=2695856 RepID=UPI003899841D